MYNDICRTCWNAINDWGLGSITQEEAKRRVQECKDKGLKDMLIHGGFDSSYTSTAPEAQTN